MSKSNKGGNALSSALRWISSAALVASMLPVGAMAFAAEYTPQVGPDVLTLNIVKADGTLVDSSKWDADELASLATTTAVTTAYAESMPTSLTDFKAITTDSYATVSDIINDGIDATNTPTNVDKYYPTGSTVTFSNGTESFTTTKADVETARKACTAAVAAATAPAKSSFYLAQDGGNLNYALALKAAPATNAAGTITAATATEALAAPQLVYGYTTAQLGSAADGSLGYVTNFIEGVNTITITLPEDSFLTINVLYPNGQPVLDSNNDPIVKKYSEGDYAAMLAGTASYNKQTGSATYTPATQIQGLYTQNGEVGVETAVTGLKLTDILADTVYCQASYPNTMHDMYKENMNFMPTATPNAWSGSVSIPGKDFYKAGSTIEFISADGSSYTTTQDTLTASTYYNGDATKTNIKAGGGLVNTTAMEAVLASEADSTLVADTPKTDGAGTGINSQTALSGVLVNNALDTVLTGRPNLVFGVDSTGSNADAARLVNDVAVINITLPTYIEVDIVDSTTGETIQTSGITFEQFVEMMAETETVNGVLTTGEPKVGLWYGGHDPVTGANKDGWNVVKADALNQTLPGTSAAADYSYSAVNDVLKVALAGNVDRYWNNNSTIQVVGVQVNNDATSNNAPTKIDTYQIEGVNYPKADIWASEPMSKSTFDSYTMYYPQTGSNATNASGAKEIGAVLTLSLAAGQIGTTAYTTAETYANSLTTQLTVAFAESTVSNDECKTPRGDFNYNYPTLVSGIPAAQYVNENLNLDAQRFVTQVQKIIIGTDAKPGPVEDQTTKMWGQAWNNTMTNLVDNSGFTAGACGNIVVASSDDWHDALSASGFAGLLDAPIVLTPKSELNADAAALINKYAASDATVYVVGGPIAIDESVDAAIKALGGKNVIRVYGQTATETAEELCKTGAELSEWSDGAILASSIDFRDALCAAPYAYATKTPVLLTNTDATDVDAATTAIINDATTKIALGGTLRVSDAVVADLGLTRYAGQTCYDTSNVFANFCVTEGGMQPNNCSVASANQNSYTDALSAAPFAAYNNAPVLLADAGYLQVVDGFITINAANIDNVNIITGPVFLGQSVVDAINIALA